ncbi:DNA polymerase III subunit delta' C-terminal domain-containing protein [Thaumasiovibrio subtropicus]|uniref:DNA polymerase III subunit delta' C-terminal domain-containing protein n=1 Tax=Thaumasiovibrio subtropicus TaxID=1891207 RepID=UPI000B34F91F|nr:DNA polymerase III subunit delta' C-terminal domain-containing protein [Thaumasiovibrio subtropicus]
MVSIAMSELYPWHSELWSQWRDLIRQQRLHHAVLLIAPQGSGRHQLTRALATALLCQNGVDEGCGVCHGCQLKAAGTHPDYHTIAPLEAGKKISVDAIRQANRWAMETSQLGGARVIEIRHADALGEAAANALLKTLEEPPSGCFYLLTADRADTVLPTILSRCSQWRQREITIAEISTWLSAQTFSVSDDLKRLYIQSPLTLFTIAEAGELQATHDVIGSFAQFVNPPYIGMQSCIDAMIKSDFDALYWVQALLLDAVKVQQGCCFSLCTYQESHAVVTQVANACHTELLWSQLQRLQELQQQFVDFTGLNQEVLIAEWLSHFMQQGEMRVS